MGVTSHYGCNVPLLPFLVPCPFFFPLLSVLCPDTCGYHLFIEFYFILVDKGCDIVLPCLPLCFVSHPSNREESSQTSATCVFINQCPLCPVNISYGYKSGKRTSSVQG